MIFGCGNFRQSNGVNCEYSVEILRHVEKLPPGDDLTSAEYQALGEFRYRIRRFLHFSEEAAKADGLEPQQH